MTGDNGSTPPRPVHGQVATGGRPDVWCGPCRNWHAQEPCDEPNEEHPCIGGDYCGRTTNGWFPAGSHGPGWYCGWCEAIPA